MALKRRRKSKLDPFVDQLGHVPDRVIADQAGVTPENVRAYRVRRGIAAGWRGARGSEISKDDVARPSAVGSASTPQSAGRGTRREGTSRGKASSLSFHPRRSRLDPYTALLGDVPDSELAAKAGVTVENVRAYRRRRGIPARWRSLGRQESETAVAAPTQRPVRVVSTREDLWAYRAVAALGSKKKEFVVLGSCMAEAAQAVEGRLSQRHGDVQLVEIALLGEALQ